MKKTVILTALLAALLFIAPAANARGNRNTGYRSGSSGYNAGPRHNSSYHNNHHHSHTSSYHTHNTYYNCTPAPTYASQTYFAPVVYPNTCNHNCSLNFGTILGLALGTAYNISLGYLTQNYAVTGYDSNAIYINNIYQYGYQWPQGTMYFNNGLLRSTSLCYPTTYYDASCYYNVYNTLTATYGTPAYVNGLTSSWYGTDGRFIRLTYTQAVNPAGVTCYSTNLSYGY